MIFNKQKIVLSIYILIMFFLSNYVIAEQKTLVIAKSTGFPPYYFADNNDEGLCPEIIKEVANSINLKIKYIKYPWSRSILSVKNGTVDAIMPLLQTPQRAEFLHYLEDNILSFEINVLFTLTDANINFDGNFEPINQYRIGSIRDYSYGKEFDNFKFSNNTKIKTEKQLIKHLLFKRRDIIVGNTYVIKYFAEKMGKGEQIKQIGPIINKDPLYIAFSKKAGTKQIAITFSKALKKFKQTEKYKQILKKYGIID